jgi:hypothetical protein
VTPERKVISAFLDVHVKLAAGRYHEAQKDFSSRRRRIRYRRSCRECQGKAVSRKKFKAPNLSAVTPESLRKRFIRVVKYQSKINHPNVVKILFADLESVPPWFVMPLAIGTLKQALLKDRTIGGKVADALFDVLAGLEALHENGIIHRDLKPENILVLPNPDGSMRFAISDFGLMSANESTSSTLTATNLGGGTPYYAAPECAIDFKRSTTLSDIYSFGAILHDVYAPHQSRIPHSELSCPGPVGPIIARCTKKSARRRYQTVAELRAALYSVVSTQDTTVLSTEESHIVEVLNREDQLSDDEWDKILDYIDNCEQDGRRLSPVFAAVQVRHIEFLGERAPPLFALLAREFCRHARTSSFEFNYCDVLADEISAIFWLGKVDIKATVGLALLEMGTSHNRWYVERRFVSLFGPQSDDRVAERLLVEADVESIDLSHSLRHLERSISISLEVLHPTIRGAA